MAESSVWHVVKSVGCSDSEVVLVCASKWIAESLVNRLRRIQEMLDAGGRSEEAYKALFKIDQHGHRGTRYFLEEVSVVGVKELEEML